MTVPSATSPGSQAAPSSQRWSELVYDGLWFSPLKRALDSVRPLESHGVGDRRGAD